MEIPEKEFERIAAMIHSPDSPVGIDAVATHVLIIRKLEEIESKLEKIEAKLATD